MVVRSKWITRRKNGFSGFGAGITGTGIVSVSGTIACDLEPQKPSSGHAPAGILEISPPAKIKLITIPP